MRARNRGCKQWECACFDLGGVGSQKDRIKSTHLRECVGGGRISGYGEGTSDSMVCDGMMRNGLKSSWGVGGRRSVRQGSESRL